MLFPPDAPSGAGSPAGSPSPGPTVGGGEGGGSSQAPAAQTRNWEKDYGELENRYKEAEPRLKAWERHGFRTEQDLDNAVAWARKGIELYNGVQRGEYVPKSAVQERQVSPVTPQDPFERWDELEPRQQAATMRDYLASELQKALKEAITPVNQQVQNHQQQTLSQQQLQMKLMRHLVKNPDLDIEKILADAVAGAATSGDRLIDMAVENAIAPRNQAKAIEDAVNAALEAERAKNKQESDNARITQFQQRSAPRLVRRAPNTRGDAMRETFNNFLKKADQLQRESG